MNHLAGLLPYVAQWHEGTVGAQSRLLGELPPRRGEQILARFGGPAPEGAPLGQGLLGDPWDVDVDVEHGIWATDRESNLIQYFFYPPGTSTD